MSQKHTFAIYSSLPLGDGKTGDQFSLRHDELYRRVYKILRLALGEELIVFDQSKHIRVLLAQEGKKGYIAGTIQDVVVLQALMPHIHLYVGLTKKDAFKEIVYFAAQMGAASVTPLLTEKVQRAWGKDNEKEKLEKIMIAACEQAKQFVLPQLCEPLSLQQALEQSNDTKLFFEAHGQPLLSFIQKSAQAPVNLSLFIGPEGGFTQSEHKLLEQSGAECYKLTPTILRSQEAVVVVLGIVRSFIY